MTKNDVGSGGGRKLTSSGYISLFVLETKSQNVKIITFLLKEDG